MIVLKNYQLKSLNILNSFLNELEKVEAKYAYMGITGSPYKSQFFNEIPYVCIKIPTGGGKTLVATHSLVDIITTHQKYKLGKGIVMWFVPSEAIKSQTLSKLKDRNDPHREVIDVAFDNRVRVYSNEEALSLRKEDVEDNLCIIVSSLEAFRKEKELQSKYKVYQENGELLGHFYNINESNLEKDVNGTIINSLANVIRMKNPLIIVDEGHRTKTELSFEFLKDLDPSFILEFTATPREESNILVNVHSAELKDEKMVKIPIILESLSLWEEAIRRGKLKRDELETLASKNSKEYIRPIALIQAQQEKETEGKVTVNIVKKFLIDDCGVDEREIAVKTSKNNELTNVDLFSNKCSIRYIITVNALAEGWDCSFAYVLMSVANVGSKISVEQIIGRILRLPYATEQTVDDLNFSYVFASAKNFNQAASTIINGLERNGYGKKDLITPGDKNANVSIEAKRVIDENFKPPIISFQNEKLEFADLIGEDFELSSQDYSFRFEPLYDNDGRIKIDIESQEKWVKERQSVLNISYSDLKFSKKELVNWLDKRLRFAILDKNDKSVFIDRIIETQLEHASLQELSLNRFYLVAKLNSLISKLLIDYAKVRFYDFLASGQISLQKFEEFPSVISLTERTVEKFRKNYYSDIEPINGEEETFASRLDTENLPNIMFWIRNRERKDPFYIQGWHPYRFYPDFIAVTVSRKIIAVEWKGLDRATNEDTEYKQELGLEWAKLGGDNVYFYLATNENIDEILQKIARIV